MKAERADLYFVLADEAEALVYRIREHGLVISADVRRLAERVCTIVDQLTDDGAEDGR